MNVVGLSSEKRVLVPLVLLVVALIAVMRTVDKPLKNNVSSSGIVSFEFGGDLPQSTAIIHSWSPEARQYAAFSLGIDYLFLTAYATLLALLCVNVANFCWKNSNELMQKSGMWLACLQIFAGLLDAIENTALINLLFGSQHASLPSIAFWAAALKFTLVGLGILYILSGIIAKIITKMNTKSQ